MQERLHKILAHAGYGSRRACEELVEAGRVTVNGRTVTLGDKAEAGSDDIRVDGRRIRAEQKVYFLLNKPKNIICTNSDPYGRRKVTDLLADVRQRVYPVGRLDADSRGLLIMTNDGDLAARLTHPRYEVPKTYEVEVKGEISGEDIQKLVSGVWLSEGRTRRSQLRLLHRGKDHSRLEITLREGRNRQVRRMLAHLDHKVKGLTRTRIGPLTLKGLGPGKYRPLTDSEVRSLVRLSGEKPEAEAEVPSAATGKTPRRRGAVDGSTARRTQAAKSAVRKAGGKGPGSKMDRKRSGGKAPAGRKADSRRTRKGRASADTGRDVSEFTF
ncbi:MAG: rRNA pseudouridine synthase [Planctomycetes bacterium]|nr:rRNA pseudouridine synthase [Planctomycetota bacterium]